MLGFDSHAAALLILFNHQKSQEIKNLKKKTLRGIFINLEESEDLTDLETVDCYVNISVNNKINKI